MFLHWQVTTDKDIYISPCVLVDEFDMVLVAENAWRRMNEGAGGGTPPRAKRHVRTTRSRERRLDGCDGAAFNRGRRCLPCQCHAYDLPPVLGLCGYYNQ